MIGLRRFIASILFVVIALIGLLALTIMPNADAAKMKEKFNAIRR